MTTFFQEGEDIDNPVVPPLTVHNLSYIGATEAVERGEGEEEGSPLVAEEVFDPNTPTDSNGRYLIPDGAPSDAWESDSLDKSVTV